MMTVEDVVDLLIWDASYKLVKLNSVLEEYGIPCVLDRKNTCLFVFASEDDKLVERFAFEIYVSKESSAIKIKCDEKWRMNLFEVFAWEMASIHTKGLMISIMLKGFAE